MIPLIAWALLAAYTLIGPVVRRGGTHAGHNALFVTLPPDSVTLAQGQHPEGRRAQELGENRLQGLVALVPALAPALLLDGPYAALAAILAYVAVKSVLYAIPAIDTAGHGAEIIVAEQDGYWSYGQQEIERMLRDPARNGMTFEDVEAELRRWEWLSKIMVRLAW